MQRWLSFLLGLAAFGLAVAVVVRTMSDAPLSTHLAHPDAALAAPSAMSPDAAARGLSTGSGAGKSRGDAAINPDAGLAPDLLGQLDPGAESTSVPGAPGHFPDGRPVPPLPDGAPKHVRLGVVLVTYAGAQGAPPNARPKKEAQELATKLASDAKTDFHAAVVRGDSGSADDIGRVPRGVLEPFLEYTVFTMAAGTVSDATETPRGFWVAKRTE